VLRNIQIGRADVEMQSVIGAVAALPEDLTFVQEIAQNEKAAPKAAFS